ncbi:MAG TPA: hypothetical protein VFF30_19165 [Nitrososphaerales archaeon]|nr:hypothetical protein [Nitrososphaerales archaeon]
MTQLRYTIGPIEGGEEIDDGLAVRDETGNQVMLLKHIVKNGEHSERSADSETFNIEDEETRAVSSPDLTKMAAVSSRGVTLHEFKLMDNDGQVIYDIKQKDNAKRPRFEVLDKKRKEVASIEEERAPSWSIKDASGHRIAISNLKIKETSGRVTSHVGKKDRSQEVKGIRAGWETSPPTVELTDRFTIVTPKSNGPLAQVYPGTTTEGGTVGTQTSDAFEITFTPAEEERQTRQGEKLEPPLILCFAVVLDYLSKYGLS